jgi:hypothetical protein
MTSMGDDSPAELPVAELLRKAERKRLRALVAGDMELARWLHAEDYELIPPGGGTISKEEYLGSVASGALHYVVFEPASEIRVRTYERAAVLRYKVRIEVHAGDVVDSDLFWHTDIYEMRGNRWQVVWSQATRIRQ